MKVFELQNGKIRFENGDLVMSDRDIEQSLYLIIKTRLGECFYNPELGINRDNLLGKVTVEQVRNEIIQGITQEPLVDVIEEVDVQINKKRQGFVLFKVTLIDGELVEGEVDIGGIG